jgi:DNA-binding XRE family transcriptional regulator
MTSGVGLADDAIALARSCERCTRPLNRYNTGNFCGGCATASPRDIRRHAGLTPPEEISARLRAARKRRGMTLMVLAGLAGVSQAYLSMVENGKRRLDRYSTIAALANALDIPPAELVPGMTAGLAAKEPADIEGKP